MKKFGRLFGIVAAITVSAVMLGCNTDKPVTVAPVTFNPVSGSAIVEGSSVKLTTTDLDNEQEIDIYYSTETALTADNFEEDGTLYEGGIKVNADCTIYAIAVNENGICSVATSAEYTVKHVPNAPVLTASAQATDGVYARGTTVALSATSVYDDDTITIYYSTTKELTRTDYEDATVYTSPIALNDYTKISAVAVNANGASIVSSATYDVPKAYMMITDTVNCGIEGNIKDVVAAVNGATESKTFDAITVKGVVTDVYSGRYMIVQDNNAAVEIYKSSITSDNFKVGDIVEIPNCTAGMLFNGMLEVTAFGDPVVTGKTRNVYFKKISNLCTDFTPYVSKNEAGVVTGDCMLYGIRGKAGEWDVAPGLIYVKSSLVYNEEKITIGWVVNYGGTIELSPIAQAPADDSIMTLDVPKVEKVLSNKASGTYDDGTQVTLSCETENVTIYYSTESKISTVIKADENKYTGPITLTDDMTFYAIAVNEDGDVSAVNTFVYYTKFNTSYAELPETLDAADKYNFDGKIAELLASCTGTSNKETTLTNPPAYVEGIIVALSGKKFYIQDKNAGAYFYNVTLPGNARVGSKVKAVVTAGYSYSGQKEFTKVSSIEVTTPKYTDTIYVQNLSGLTDFTPYEAAGKLCAYRGYTSDLPYAKGAKANINKGILNGLSSDEKTFIGYVYTYTGNSVTQIYTFVEAPADTVAYPATYVCAPVFSKTGEVEASTAVTVTSVTEGAEVYLQFIAADDKTTTAMTAETYATAGTKSSSYTVTAAGTLYAIAINGEYKSKVSSAAYTIKANNAETISFATNNWSLVSGNTSGGGDGTITGSDATIVISQGEGTVNACWNSSGHIRIYAKNTVTITSTRTISKIEITMTGTSNTGTLSASVGTYTLAEAEGTWEGSAKSVVFTNTAASGHARITSIKITYAD